LLKLLYPKNRPTTLLDCAQELEVEKFITHSVPFAEINKAFDLMAKGEGIRCIIRMEN
jgi:alcohol dehydrogenase class-P